MKSGRSASLSGMKHCPASEQLKAGDVLSVALDTLRKSLLFSDTNGEIAGYVPGGRGCAEDVSRALARDNAVQYAMMDVLRGLPSAVPADAARCSF